MRKPILLISPLPPPYGGIATWTHELLYHGLPDGSQFTLVDTKIRGKRNIFDPGSFSFAEIFRSGRVISALIYQFIINRPRIVHLNSSLSTLGIFRDMGCAILAKIFRIPIISHYHGNLPDFHGKRFFGLSQWCLKYLMRISTMNIVENKISFSAAKKLNKKNANILLMPNFIQDTTFDLKIKKETCRCRAIFAGGITKAKGCAEILEVANQLSEIDFHLFGKVHADVAPLFNQAPKNIFLHGVISHDTLLKEMCKSDFLIFPSYTEGFPLTVLEAMAVGLPIIATTVGAIPEMVEHNLGGFLVAPKDVTGLVAMIKILIADQQLRIAMGNYNKQKGFNHYRYSIVIKNLLNLYNQLSK